MTGVVRQSDVYIEREQTCVNYDIKLWCVRPTKSLYSPEP